MTEPALRRPALLDPKRHDRSAFDSGEPALDEWLRRYAGQNRRRDTAATWVIATAEDVVVAYASVAMTAIDRAAAPPAIGKGAPDPVPALLIGRLAVERGAVLGLADAEDVLGVLVGDLDRPAIGVPRTSIAGCWTGRC